MLLVQYKFMGTGKGEMTGSLVDHYFTDSLTSSFDTYVKFIFVLIGLSALLGALKVYNKAMQGDDNVKGFAFRWVAAILAALVVTVTTARIFEGQSGSSTSSVHFGIPK